jgi:hypothetical protein
MVFRNNSSHLYRGPTDNNPDPEIVDPDPEPSSG